MNSSTYRFILDLHSTQSQISLPVTLGDTARVLEISLSDGGLPYIIEKGALAKLEIKRPTGTYLEEFCSIERNTTIRYPFTQNQNTAAVAGVHDCSVTLYDEEGNKIGSPRFSMVVSDRVVNSDDINITDEDKSAIDAMIAAEASRRDAETGRVNAESSRVTSEGVRENAEIARMSAFNEAVSASNEATARANQIAEILEEKLANGEFNGADGGDFNTAGLKVACDINTSTYVMTVAIKDATGNVLSSDTVDLPLEEMIVSGRADGEKITLTLKNGETIQFSVSDIVSGLVSQESYNADISRIESALGSYITDIDALVGGGA